MEDSNVPAKIGKDVYRVYVQEFDAAVCEAIAVSQASANRLSAVNISYASYVFTQMCGAATSMIRASPLTRWVRSDFEDWRFGAVAGHARSLLDGFLLLNYLLEVEKSEDELSTRINVMHLNDCTRRLEMFKRVGATEQVASFEEHHEDLKQRLLSNKYFISLPAPVQKNCLNGRFLTIDTRDQMLTKVGFEKGFFDVIYDLWSQHIHILPLSFYRMEANGRGTGLENDTDRFYLSQALEICTTLLESATDLMMDKFPDVAIVRKGVKSSFSPGPNENKPRKTKSSKLDKIENFQKTTISAAVSK